MIYRPATTRGFTLVETLVAITIITLAMVGPLYAVERSLTASYVGRDQLIASALAQEGVEYVRAVRDGNYLYNLHNAAARDWLYGLSGAGKPNCFSSDGCVIDDTPSALVPVAVCSNGVCPALNLSNSQAANAYFYNQQAPGSANKQTIFTRKVVLTNIVAGREEVRVTVTVTFVNHGKTYTIQVQDVLENWL